MNTEDYYVKQAKESFERDKKVYEIKIKGWKNVERYKTKDGKDYAALSKNFTKGVVSQNQYTHEKELHMCIEENRRYYNDEIAIVRPVQDKEEQEKYKKEGRLIERGAILYPCIELTPDEIEEAIKERIEYYENNVRNIEKVMKDFDKVAGKLVELRKEAEEILKEQPSIAYYKLRSIVREERLN